MAFCNSCGANITPGTRFCNKCGAAILASTLPPAANPPAAGDPVAPAAPVPLAVSARPPSSGGGGLKAILIVVGVVVLVGILGLAALGTLAWRIARRAHVRQDGNNVKVETPFGTVESTKDPQEAARNLGVDIYPGAQVQKDGSTSLTIGNVHTAALNAESTDSPDKVCNFYKSKFPNATVMSAGTNDCTIVSNDQNGSITIYVKTENGRTRIVITHVTKSGANSSAN
jgi:hypothetical protein